MNVRLNYRMGFTAGVFYQDQLRMNEYNLVVWLITNTDNPDNHDTAFARLKHFVYNQLDSSIIINQNNVEQAQRYQQAGLRVTTMPGEPVDQIVGIMLFHKLNAIMEDRMLILETEISSSIGDNMVYLHAENENAESFVMPAWWTASDISQNSLLPVDSDKVFTIHQFNHAAWHELDLAWPEVTDRPPSGNTIVLADFLRDETK
jgi:hypothetical protein